MRSRIAAVRARMDAALARAGRPAGSALLVAVSKTHTAATVAEAARAGLSVFGENRVQEAAEKIPQVARLLGLTDPETGRVPPGEGGAPGRSGQAAAADSQEIPGAIARAIAVGGTSEATGRAETAGGPGRSAGLVSWHLVGHLQSNKAKPAVALFDLVHSVDGAELARKLDRAAAEAGKRQAVLLQVSLVGEETKSGVPAGALGALVDAVSSLPHLVLRGLMTIPPYDPDPELSRPFFAALREMGEQVAGWAGRGYPGDLSMGMTEDFEVAIEEGATIVRVGRALFGERAS